MSGSQTHVPWFIAAAVIVAGIALLAWLALSPMSGMAAHPAACLNNLRQIGTAIRLYAVDHSGQRPDSLARLLKTGHLTGTKVLVCPASNTQIPEDFPTDFEAADLADLEPIDDIADYVIVPDLADNAPNDFIMAYERHQHGDAGARYVCFCDGHVKWLSEEKFQRRMDAQRRRMHPQDPSGAPHE